jgi:RNA polymerase sigma-70 factor (ECF subfamily)
MMTDSKLYDSSLNPKTVSASIKTSSPGASQPQEDPDAALLLRFKRGDETAFEILVDKFKGPVFNYIWRQIGNMNEAEDIAQNVFVQVYKSAPRYEPKAKFTTWLFTIARNLCLNEFRRRQRHPLQSLDESISDDSTEERQFEDHSARSPSSKVTEDELQEKINAAIQDLPENQKTALLLCRYEGLSYLEIAKVLKTSESATKSLIHRARETLKEKLSDYLRET